MLNISELKLYAGDKWNWTEVIDGYTSDEYNLVIILKSGAGTKITITAADNADGSFNPSKVASETKEVTNGNYTYYARLTSKADPEDVTTYETGTIHIYPNIETAGDVRGKWAKIYDNLVDAYDQMIEAGHLATTISINGRTETLDRAQILTEIYNAANRAGIDPSGVVGPKKSRQILTRLY